MKHLLIFVFAMLSGAAIYAQIPNGTYSTNDEKLTFSGDSIAYHLNTHSCLVSDYKGKGTYEISKKLLIIKPIVSSTSKSIIEPVKMKSTDTLYLDICDDLSKSPMSGASVFVMRNHHMVSGNITGLNGRIGILRSKLLSTDSIKVSWIGYKGVTLKPEPGADYKIMMKVGFSDRAELAYVSNQDKGYVYRLTKTELEVNFVQTRPCGKKRDNWIVFKKE